MERSPHFLGKKKVHWFTWNFAFDDDFEGGGIVMFQATADKHGLAPIALQRIRVQNALNHGDTVL